MINCGIDGVRSSNCEFTVLSNAGCNVCLIRFREVHDGRLNEGTHDRNMPSEVLFLTPIPDGYVAFGAVITHKKSLK